MTTACMPASGKTITDKKLSGTCFPFDWFIAFTAFAGRVFAAHASQKDTNMHMPGAHNIYKQLPWPELALVLWDAGLDELQVQFSCHEKKQQLVLANAVLSFCHAGAKHCSTMSTGSLCSCTVVFSSAMQALSCRFGCHATIGHAKFVH